MLQSVQVLAHVFVDLPEAIRLLPHLLEAVPQVLHIPEGGAQGVQKPFIGFCHPVHLTLQLLHFPQLRHRVLLVLLPLLLNLSLLLHLPLSLHFDLLVLLHLQNSVVHFHQQVRQLGIYFVDQIRKVNCSLVVYPLEEHHSSEILGEVLSVLFRHLPLKNANNLLLVG